MAWRCGGFHTALLRGGGPAGPTSSSWGARACFSTQVAVGPHPPCVDGEQGCTANSAVLNDEDPFRLARMVNEIRAEPASPT